MTRRPLPLIQQRRATLSTDKKYRYSLERRWNDAEDDSPYVLWCMLNPSTADGLIDDPTIRRCIGFTDALGFGRLVVVNLYAYRATNPRELEGLNADELVGPDNYAHLAKWVRDPARRILICAWGGNRFKCVPLSSWVVFTERYALGFTKDGEPKHPLYLPADSQLTRVAT